MPEHTNLQAAVSHPLAKSLTGISGLDEITFGGLPTNRTTLICGSAGCGKTLLALEFVIRGAIDFDEPGVFISFEETPEELTQNLTSLGYDLTSLEKDKKLAIDHIVIERGQIEESGNYDLEGLFVRLGYAIDSVGAKRIAIDTIEALFAGFRNELILRSELNRLFDWLKAKGVTSVITGEQGAGTLTRYGLEEYVSDCVIFLDHRVEQGITTRRLRIVKYRGSHHGTNEYPFLIDQDGIAVMPITSIGLNHEVTRERLSSGVRGLDDMLGGKGFYRGSGVLISGMAGTGKTTFAANFSIETCRRGEKSLFFGFEESLSQFARNMESIGLDFEPWLKEGLFKFEAARPTLYGLESHLVAMYREIESFKPCTVVVDPISTFFGAGSSRDVKSMLMRLMDYLKSHRVSSLFTSLLHDERHLDSTDVGVSSLIDTWILLRTVEMNGERNRALNVIKSRGMSHSNQVREYRFSERGVEMIDVYVGPSGILTGSARLTQEARDRIEREILQVAQNQKRRALERKRIALEAQIASLRAEFEADEEDLEHGIASSSAEIAEQNASRKDFGRLRSHESGEGAPKAPAPEHH